MAARSTSPLSSSVMTEMHPLGMVAATPAILRADGTAPRLVPLAAPIATLTARATGMKQLRQPLLQPQRRPIPSHQRPPSQLLQHLLIPQLLPAPLPLPQHQCLPARRPCPLQPRQQRREFRPHPFSLREEPAPAARSYPLVRSFSAGRDERST